MIFYKGKCYSSEKWKKLCQHNGCFKSYKDYVEKCPDFSIPYYVEIIQSDFDINPVSFLSTNKNFSGTLQLCNNGYYFIKEDITFNFNEENLYMPFPEQTQKISQSLIDKNYLQQYLYPTYKFNGAYDLGFFAGIIIDGENIVLTSNNKKLQMSKQMHLIQRFFATICLGSSPFIMNQGPIDQSLKIRYPKYITIKNIHLGLSSHHNILGNNSNIINMQHNIFYDFETAAITLNNCDNVNILNNNIKQNLKAVPANSDFFAFVMQTRIFAQLSKQYPELEQMYIEFNNHLQEIIKFYPLIDPEFKNTTNGLTDAIAMGVQITQIGVSVDNTGICNPITIENEQDKSKNIVIKNNIISNISAHPLQTPAVVNSENKPIILSNGKLFYKSSTAKTQHWFLQWVASLSPEDWNVYKNYFKPTSLTPEVAQQLLDNYPFKPYCNADIMNHLLKPVFGVRLQYLDNLQFINNKICNIRNCSKKPTCPPNGVKHIKTECLNSTDSIGLFLIYSSNKLENNKICNITSKYGKGKTFVYKN